MARGGQHSPSFPPLLLDLRLAPGFPCTQLAPALKGGEKYKNWAKRWRRRAHEAWGGWESTAVSVLEEQQEGGAGHRGAGAGGIIPCGSNVPSKGNPFGLLLREPGWYDSIH